MDTIYLNLVPFKLRL